MLGHLSENVNQTLGPHDFVSLCGNGNDITAKSQGRGHGGKGRGGQINQREREKQSRKARQILGASARVINCSYQQVWSILSPYESVQSSSLLFPKF